MSVNCIYYLDPLLSSPASLQRTASSIVAGMRGCGKPFKAIACRGFSGMIVAPLVAAEMQTHLIAVRKPEKNNHSSRDLEGYVGGGGYAIIDDLIDTGATIREIHAAVVSGWENHIKTRLSRQARDKIRWPADEWSQNSPDHMKIPPEEEPNRPRLMAIFLYSGCDRVFYLDDTRVPVFSCEVSSDNDWLQPRLKF